MGSEPLEGLHMSLIYTAAALPSPPISVGGRPMGRMMCKNKRKDSWLEPVTEGQCVGDKQKERLRARRRAKSTKTG